MKKYLYLLVMVLALSPAFQSCSDDSDFPFELKLDESTTRSETYNYMIEKPTWLKDVVKAMGERYKPFSVVGPDIYKYPYPEVYLFEYKGEQYIYLCDWLSSSITVGNRFFTTDGKEITADLTDPQAYESSFYHELLSGGLKGQCIWSIYRSVVDL